MRKHRAGPVAIAAAVAVVPVIILAAPAAVAGPDPGTVILTRPLGEPEPEPKPAPAPEPAPGSTPASCPDCPPPPSEDIPPLPPEPAMPSPPRPPEEDGGSTAPSTAPSSGVAGESVDAEEAPHRRTFTLGAALPLHSRVEAGAIETVGASLAFDATALWELSPHVRVGGALGYMRWRNVETATRPVSNALARAVAVARFDLGTGPTRLYGRLGLGLGLSVLTPDFIIYEPRTLEGSRQTTAIDNRYGLAELYEVAFGCRRALEGRWAMVAEVVVSGARMGHDAVFTNGDGTRTAVGAVDLDSVEGRFGVEMGF